jgi:uncharacterized protein with FMN-binding domain
MTKKATKIMGIIVGIIVILIIAISVTANVLKKDLNALKNAPISDTNISILKDGKYHGEYQVAPISVKLDVYVQAGRITKIDLIEHKNGKGKPAEASLQKIIDNQKINVDSVSGATYSSMVIKKAIEKALENNK